MMGIELINWSALVTFIGAALGRNIMGWLQTATADGTIDRFEWLSLAKTVLRILTLSSAAYFGLNLTEEQAAGIAVLLDIAISHFGNKKVPEVVAPVVKKQKK